MVEQKPDAAQIRDALAGLKHEFWVGADERRWWWPDYVFHYTDLRNAVSILKDGRLLSRMRAETEGKLVVSSGSSSVLAGTGTWVKDCVRLYFRPLTPTQYWAEGIQSSATLARSRYRDAHCPVPVFFLFDSSEILTRADCKFADGGLNKPSRVFTTARDLRNLPWEKIYHTDAIDPMHFEESDIAHRRNAEVIVPRELDLDALCCIHCRSAAEKETLQHLLPLELRHRYQDRIMATTYRMLFYRRHTYIETVHLSSHSASFYFPSDTSAPGPFQLHVECDKPGFRHCDNPKFFAAKPLRLELPGLVSEYMIRLELDGHLAYENSYKDMKVSF